MARARNIKPGFFTNGDLIDCQPLARLLFAGLWCEADRRGILEDRPKTLKVKILPGDDCDIDELLIELMDRGFIERYDAGRHRCIRILNFEKHQNPHVNERPNDLPLPEQHHASTVQTPEQHGANPADSLIPHPSSLIPSSSTASSSSADAREEPPPSGKATYADVLNGALPSLLTMLQQIDKQFTDGWLKTMLVAAESEVGPLPRDRLGKGLDLAVDQIKRQVETGTVRNPRMFARKVIVDYLMEQRNDRPRS